MYETLDAIADSYNPLLGLVTLALLAHTLWRRRWAAAGRLALTLFGGLAIAYTVRWIDYTLDIWPALGMDYSTHSAVAIAITFSLIAAAPRWGIPALIGLLGYALLMLYQEYHSVADILLTALAIAPLWWCVFLLSRAVSREVATQSA
ncbi:hypothetical protein EUZ85_03670 [Hahella sp. KA22]|uniref:hypothetical protein n=1 Tax=Hahella sp. KA22 TaxID=1628392 RepID=UPI000FDF5228|nr:hypothetical protein [Hahella sp. KA22]AZZ89855.1 hypothetical protein ENC22_01125 [Hahella sp. KA22]QAY53224.1 hypothetical protein EUZ85_03670 [Hahella sp. KA22]